MMHRNPALSAFLAQTPANEGGQPMTAPPAMPQGDPMASPLSAAVPLMPTMKMGPPGNPYETAMVARAHQVPVGGLGLPAVSKAQQRFFAIAEHDPHALRGRRPMMTKAQMHDFAATPRKGLPEKKRRIRG